MADHPQLPILGRCAVRLSPSRFVFSLSRLSIRASEMTYRDVSSRSLSTSCLSLVFRTSFLLCDRSIEEKLYRRKKVFQLNGCGISPCREEPDFRLREHFVYARILGKVRELQLSHGIDLIHAHAPLPCGHAAMLMSAELEIPYVVSVHGLDAFSTEQVHGRAGDWCRRISQRVYLSSRRVDLHQRTCREQVLEGTGRNAGHPWSTTAWTREFSRQAKSLLLTKWCSVSAT